MDQASKTIDQLVAEAYEREAQAARCIRLMHEAAPTREQVAAFFGCDVSKVCRTRSGAWTMR